MNEINSDRLFTETEQQVLYDVIFHRRDVRAFRPDAVPDDVLQRILSAAHAAPSVGFMQPWNFILVSDRGIREMISKHFQEQNAIAAEHYRDGRKQLYDSLKLEGILESPLNIVVTCDPNRGGPHVLGRNTIPETDRFSVCCAIQNFWLAARAENIGVGWVSILEPEFVKRVLEVPEAVELIAYLCVGYPKEFYAEPELQSKGWRNRINLEKLCFYEKWNQQK